MRTGDNQAKKKVFFTLSCVLMLTCAFVLGCYFIFRERVTVRKTKGYYFLTRTCEEATVSAFAGETYLAGGAGYLYQGEENPVIVLAAYPTEQEAQSVYTSLQDGFDAEITFLQGDAFTLYGSASQDAQQILANYGTAESCIALFYDVANGLERGTLSQGEARAAIQGGVRALKGLREGNGGRFSAWNEQLAECERKGTEIVSGIIFAKDVRYLQVQLCVAMLGGEENFI